MTDFDERLNAAALQMGKRLEGDHLAPATRRRVRVAPLLCLLLLAGAALAMRGQEDPAAVIAADYAETARLEALLRPERWSAEQRETFHGAMAQVDRSIALVNDALRREPEAEELVELCHLAHRAKHRLVQTYHDTLGDRR